MMELKKKCNLQTKLKQIVLLTSGRQYCRAQRRFRDGVAEWSQLGSRIDDDDESLGDDDDLPPLEEVEGNVHETLKMQEVD